MAPEAGLETARGATARGSAPASFEASALRSTGVGVASAAAMTRASATSVPHTRHAPIDLRPSAEARTFILGFRLSDVIA
jgi:hypothetical protein